MDICVMNKTQYDEIFDLWSNTPGMGLNTVDDSSEGFTKYLTRNPTTCFVAKVQEKIIGTILSGHDGRRGYIHHLAVKNEERKKGIGRKLVDASIKSLQKEGITKVAFVVFKTNKIGNSFWEKLGFDAREDLVYRNKLITSAEMKKITIDE